MRKCSASPAGRHYFFPAGQPGIGSATDLPNAFYAQQSFQAIRRLTVAFVVFTPIGAALHHWNLKTRVHTIRILRGEDPLAVEVDGTRLVMVDSQGQLNMVSPRDLSAEEAWVCPLLPNLEQKCRRVRGT